MTLLDFEKTIVELELKLNDMKRLAEGGDQPVTEAVAALERKIFELKKETFENLNGWQRVQLSRDPERGFTNHFFFFFYIQNYENLNGWQRVQLSRHPERGYTLDYIYAITEEFVELHGDRNVADDKAMVGGLGVIEGQTFMFMGQQKGCNTKERKLRNFGMPNPEGYRKALRLMKLAEKYNKPIVTLIDTP